MLVSNTCFIPKQSINLNKYCSLQILNTLVRIVVVYLKWQTQKIYSKKFLIWMALHFGTVTFSQCNMHESPSVIWFQSLNICVCFVSHGLLFAIKNPNNNNNWPQSFNDVFGSITLKPLDVRTNFNNKMIINCWNAQIEFRVHDQCPNACESFTDNNERIQMNGIYLVSYHWRQPVHSLTIITIAMAQQESFYLLHFFIVIE